MRVVKTLLSLVLVAGLVAGAAYGAGAVLRHHDQRTVAAGDHPDDGAASDPATSAPTPGSPTTPPSTPSGPPSPAPVREVMQPGARGTQVRELQARLHQLAWLPETTTGVYDGATVAAVKGFQAKHGLARTGVLDRRTWQRVIALTDRPGHDAMFNVLHPGTTSLRPRRPRLVGPRPAGPPRADRVVRRRRHRQLRRRDRRRGQGLPGQAGHPGHRRRGPSARSTG